MFDMFTYKRPMGSPTEQEFVDRFIMPWGFQRDDHQNLVLIVGDNPRILFSSHVDTVHREEGFQNLFFDGQFLTSDASCLGADDTAGVWLMLEMIKAQIPGVYVIHHGEERGCIGSRKLAMHNPEFFDWIDIAIAFDRAGYTDVITHQMGARCASDAFAASFAGQLGLGFTLSDEGVYTDTNEYVELVAECTNISVGYHGQHSSRESQDVPFLHSLRDALLAVNWDLLIVEREPKLEEPPLLELSIESLCEDYPDVAADILRAFGLNVNDFIREIRDSYGLAA
ncbi:M28 family peptidase [Rhizobium arsenicireducens]